MKVLIVDDDPMLRNLLADELEERGHTVVEVGDAEAGLALCEHESFDLAFIDWHLPGMNGTDFCATFRSSFPDATTLLLMLTAHRQPELLDEALKSGADDFMQKPVHSAQLNIRLTIAARRVAEIEARKKAEEEKMRAESRARLLVERTERLHAVGYLAAGVAHEVNNPLQGMMNHLGAVRRGVPDDFAAMENLDMVDKAVLHIASIVRRLLSLNSEHTEVGAQCCDCGKTVEYTLEMVRSLFRKKKVKLTSDIACPDSRLAISSRELTQVLLNLLVNAHDAVAEGGNVSVKAKEVGDELVELALHDDGVGMDEEGLAQIFNPFYTTKGVKGTGLGLSLTESIVRDAGGKIEVNSKPGEGATFTLTLPRINA